jgi:hypothetical protein
MTTFVVGHGGLAADRPMTIVPEGGSITFYTDVDFDLLFPNGMAAVMAGDAGSGYKAEGGKPVENYSLSPLTDNERVRYESVAKGGLTAMYVGDQLPAAVHLCEGDEVMCGGGRHICGGVFGRINDPNIVYLACRGVKDAPSKTQREYGTTGDASVIDAFDAMWNQITALSDEEQGKKLCEMEDAHDPDLQDYLAHLMNYPDLRKAAYKERTRQALATMEPPAFVAMFNGQPAQEQAWMREIPAVVQALEKAKKPSPFGNRPRSSTV